MLVTVIALDVRQTLDVGEPTARACLAFRVQERGRIACQPISYTIATMMLQREVIRELRSTDNAITRQEYILEFALYLNWRVWLSLYQVWNICMRVDTTSGRVDLYFERWFEARAYNYCDLLSLPLAMKIPSFLGVLDQSRQMRDEWNGTPLNMKVS